MAVALKQTAEATSKAVGGFREAIQDILVPELRAVKATIDALTQEMRLRNEQVAQEMRLRDANLREELRLRDAALKEELRAQAEEARLRDSNMREELRAASDRSAREVKVLADRFDTALDIRERLIALEARLPRVQ